MRKFICCCLLIITTVSLSAQIKKQLKNAQHLLDHYQIEEGTQLLQRVAKKIKPPHKKYGDFLFLQAKLMRLEGKYLSANQLIQKAIELLPIAQQIEALTFQGNLLTELNQLEVADSLLNLAYKLYVDKHLKNILIKTKVIDALGLLKIEQQQYQLADSLYNIAIGLLESAKNTHQATYVQLLYHIGESQLEQEQLTLAQSSLEKAEKYLNQFTHQNNPAYRYIWNHLGRLYTKQSKFELAEKYYQKALERELLYFSKQHVHARIILNNLGSLYYELGNHAASEEILLQLINTSQYQKITPNLYARSLVLLGQVYIAMGRDELAITYYQKAKLLFAELNNIAEYSNNLNSLANLYKKNNQVEKSIQLLEEGRTLLKEKGTAKSLTYVAILINLGLYYVDFAQPQQAELLLLEAKDLVLETLGEEHDYYAAVLNNLAYLYESMQQYQKAKQLYLETEQVDKKVIGEKHPYFMYTLVNIASIYALLHQPDKALSYYRRLLKGQTNLIYNYYSTFEEATRLSYLKESTRSFERFFSFVALQDSITTSAYIDLQNASLATKSLALDFSVDNKIQIDSLQDAEANTFFKEWTALRQQLSQAYTMSEQEKKEAGFDLTALEEQATLVEKKLVRSNEAMAQQLNRQQIVTFEAIEAGLAAQEAAIDFIKFRYRPPTGTTDSILYGALLTRSGDTAPQFFQLAEEKQLVRLLKAKIRSNGSNYIANPKIGYALYELLWQPLQPYLTDIKTIKISPTGLLHKVAFAALPIEQAGGKTLMNQFRFDYYGNLKDLVKKEKQPTFKEKSITLVGGANFDLDSLALLDLAKDLTTSSSISENQILASISSTSNTRGADFDSTRSAIRFNYLQGTEKEVASIAKQLTAQKWQVQKLIGADALEDRVKLLGGKYAPSVLHIATHGYFFSPLKNRKAKSRTLKDRIQAATNPLVRSGLVFTGVNHTWQGGGRIPNLNDGVLTAYEISNLDLFNTDLVVLSACETGLGDIYDTEGVFGLQRAFKMAGVQQLITSLWKVPDSQTSELMNLFYQHYIVSNDATQALYKAQLTLSQQYPPYYWAAFILVE